MAKDKDRTLLASMAAVIFAGMNNRKDGTDTEANAEMAAGQAEAVLAAVDNVIGLDIDTAEITWEFDFDKGTEAVEALIQTDDEAREAAIEWQKWMAGQSLSYLEIADWQSMFQAVGSRFGLFEEFAENGII